MEPPTWTVLVRLVRTTAVVVTEPLAPDVEAGLLLMLVDATATAPATAPPTRAPTMAAMATIRLAENSATGACFGERAYSAAGGTGPVDLDRSRRWAPARTGHMSAGLLRAQLRCLLE